MEKIAFENGREVPKAEVPCKNATTGWFFPLTFISRKDCQKSISLDIFKGKGIRKYVPAFILDVSCRLQIPELGGNVKSQERSQTARVAKRCLDCHLGPSAEAQHGLVTLQKSQEKKS